MLSGTLCFTCGKDGCNESIKIDSGEFDFQNTWSDEERSMGTEEGYEAAVYVACPNCGEEYEVSYSYSEYPIGAINFEDGPHFDKEVKKIKSTLTVF